MSTTELKRELRQGPGPIKNLIAGGVGGVCIVLVGHPLDTIKVSSFTVVWWFNVHSLGQTTNPAKNCSWRETIVYWDNGLCDENYPQ